MLLISLAGAIQGVLGATQGCLSLEKGIWAPWQGRAGAQRAAGASLQRAGWAAPNT